MSLVGDDLRVGSDFVPGRRRRVGIETGLREQRSVVRQAHAVGLRRHGVDLARRVLSVHEHVRVELVGVGKGADARVNVDELALLDQALAVRERDRVDVRERARGECRREGRGRPVVLLPVDRDPRVLGLELAHLEIERVEGILRAAWPKAGNRDGHRLVGRDRARAAGRARCAGYVSGAWAWGSGRDAAGAHGDDGRCDHRQRLEPAIRLGCHFLTHLDVSNMPCYLRCEPPRCGDL